MSIIHEALKKSGSTMMTESRNPQEKRSYGPALLGKNRRNPWGPFVVVLLLVLVSAPLLAPLFEGGPAGSGEISMGTPLAPSSGNQKRQFAVEEVALPMLPAAKPAAASPRPGRFALSGIVYSPEESYALINGTVVKVGERVGDATLTGVTSDTATLDYRGRKIELSADGA